jgi:hypothetical protein
MEIVYVDPIKWTPELFKNRDAVFGKKVLVDKAMDSFPSIRIPVANRSLSSYFNHIHADDLVETVKPRETYIPEITNAYCNNPVTVVLWADGTKTMVRCQNGDEYSPETGLALCIAKKALGNMPNFNNVLKKWIPKETEPVDISAVVSGMDPVAKAAHAIATDVMSKFKEALHNGEA